MMLLEFLIEHFPGEEFELNQPCSLTMWKDGKYKVVHSIGGLKLRVFSLRRGAKNQLIFSLKEGKVTKDHYEMGLNDAMVGLDGFKSVYESLESRYADYLAGIAREDGEMKEDEADRDARRLIENPLFGSW